MSSQNTNEPPDRSPEELAAVLADLAAEAGTPPASGGRPVWRPVGDTTPDIWAVTPAPDAAAPPERTGASEVVGDPLSQLDHEVSRLETESPGPPAPRSHQRAVPDPALAPPLERVGSVADAWSTLRAGRPGAGRTPRARLLSGVTAAAKRFSGQRRDT